MDNDGVGEHGNEKVMGPEEAPIGRASISTVTIDCSIPGSEMCTVSSISTRTTKLVRFSSKNSVLCPLVNKDFQHIACFLGCPTICVHIGPGILK